MAAPSTPASFYCQTADAKNFLSWSLTATATSYSVQRSTDGVTFTTVASPSTNSYLDTTVTTGTQYYYQVAATNGSGTSPYTAAQSVVPCAPGEVSLGQIRLLSQQRADRVGSNFVTLPEWNEFIRLACYELYDLLIDTYDDYFVADPVKFNTNGTQAQYKLPDGLTTFTNGFTGQTFTAPALYKLRGVDLAAGNANNGFVTVGRFNFEDRNKYFYPNTASTMYGVFNLSYRLMGSNIQFIPMPSGNQVIQLWYIPRLNQLLQDTDMTSMSISGWIQYVIVRAAKYALDKEESDTSQLDIEIQYLKTRIEAAAANRDAGEPDTIADTRSNNGGWAQGGPGNGFQGGW